MEKGGQEGPTALIVATFYGFEPRKIAGGFTKHCKQKQTTKVTLFAQFQLV